MFMFRAKDSFAAHILPVIGPGFARADNDNMCATNESYAWFPLDRNEVVKSCDAASFSLLHKGL